MKCKPHTGLSVSLTISLICFLSTGCEEECVQTEKVEIQRLFLNKNYTILTQTNQEITQQTFTCPQQVITDAEKTQPMYAEIHFIKIINPAQYKDEKQNYEKIIKKVIIHIHNPNEINPSSP